MISGAAPISPKSLEFLRVVFGTNVHEGYGATETAAALSITSNGDVWLPFGSHVGPPLPCNEVKLVDVPDMKYLSTDKPYPRGEICCRGPNVMLGYYKEPQKTAEALDDQGYYHTGDIGVILPNGTIKIVDRVKHLFKVR